MKNKQAVDSIAYAKEVEIKDLESKRSRIPTKLYNRRFVNCIGSIDYHTEKLSKETKIGLLAEKDRL